MNKVKPVKNININLQSLLEIGSVQMKVFPSHKLQKVFPSHKLQKHAYEQQNPFSLKKDIPLTEKSLESIE